MRILIGLLISLSLLGQVGLAQDEPYFSFPSTIEVLGNGLHSVAFSARLLGVPAEEEENISYTLKGLPAEAPRFFDKASKIFFWRPLPSQVGSYRFEFLAEDEAGNKYSKSADIKVLKAPSLEALPGGWKDMKKEEKYLIGREYLPSSRYLEMEIAAVPGYELVVKVINSLSQECTLKYVPKEGKTEADKRRLTAVIKLGGEYATEATKKVCRDVYEDLYDSLGFIFKNIESVELKGAYILDSFAVYDQCSLVAASKEWDITLPSLNLSFDDRFYEEAMYSKKEPILIADSPTIKIEFNTPSGLIWKRSRLVIDEREYHAIRGDFSLVVVKPYKDISSFDVNYAMYMLRIPSAKKLSFGEHELLFEAETAFGILVTQEAYARVVTLPAQIIGRPLVFPSPFAPGIHTEVNIQYELSMQANIELAVFASDGTCIIRRRFFMGEEGAKKGINTVVWDGKSDAGRILANGIYTGILIDRDENRVLEKFKVAVFR